MRIDIISVQPKMFAGFLTESIVARAVKKGACEIAITDLREFGEGRWKKVDDKPYGGGPGMLMCCEPWFAAVESCLGNEVEKKGGISPERSEPRKRSLEGCGQSINRLIEYSNNRMDSSVHLISPPPPKQTRIIMTTPTGKKFTQRDAEMLAKEDHLVFLCGHYEGFDARIETLVTDKYSVGDFVMTGGELAAAAMTDAIVRLLPGVLGGGPAATASESFGRKGLLEAPQYTHPPEFRGMRVPEVLLSGDHAKIEAWRAAESRKLTAQIRPDLLK